MHQILVFPLSKDIKIIFSSVVDLGSITCCDRLTVTLQNGDQSTTLVSDLSGCDVVKLQQNLKTLIDGQILQAWGQQLELLHVVMEENELEKKSRGKGCC